LARGCSLSGTALVCFLLVTHAQSHYCTCPTHVAGLCSGIQPNCECKIFIASDLVPVDCTKLIPKCLLMKKRSRDLMRSRRRKPQNVLIYNDGLYNPDCEGNGRFKARQCNKMGTCWCVNSAGVRRTDKGDGNWTCQELVRTFRVVIQIARNSTDAVPDTDLKKAIEDTITDRYKLPIKYVTSIEFEGPLIYVNLKQNSSEVATNDVDIADVAFYMENDIKGDPFLPPDDPFQILVDGKNIGFKEPLIFYIDEKDHEISMKRLTAGVIAVAVVVGLAIVAGIIVMVLASQKKGRCERAEVDKMNEMQNRRSDPSLPL
uniref:Thyroglobulin type-1 domain-containing protein n=1 Tax=Leptobrachium leishanense TaxID=445787 RepID=A0A8C5MEX0_9ANUR